MLCFAAGLVWMTKRDVCVVHAADSITMIYYFPLIHRYNYGLKENG